MLDNSICPLCNQSDQHRKDCLLSGKTHVRPAWWHIAWQATLALNGICADGMAKLGEARKEGGCGMPNQYVLEIGMAASLEMPPYHPLTGEADRMSNAAHCAKVYRAMRDAE